MSHLPFHQQQLKFMISLTQHRLEFLDPIFRFLNYFDSIYFFLFLIPVIWLGYSYRWGIRIFYWFTLNTLMITSAKIWVGWPRPSTDLPQLGMLHPQSNGFPSGGAMTCMFLGILLIYYWRTKAAWIIGILYILLISFSRLYLGVHYPIDILGGWVFACILALLFIYLKNPIEHFLKKRGLYFCLLLSTAIPIAIMLITSRQTITFIMGSTLGIGIGIYISLKYGLFLPDSKSLQEGFVRSFIGIAALFLLYFLLPSRSFFTSFSIGLFMSTLASPICKWFTAKKSL